MIMRRLLSIWSRNVFALFTDGKDVRSRTSRGQTDIIKYPRDRLLRSTLDRMDSAVVRTTSKLSVHGVLSEGDDVDKCQETYECQAMQRQ